MIPASQHPRARALLVCIQCKGAKEEGLVLCWDCHHKQKRLHDGCYSAITEATLDLIEAGKIAVDDDGNLSPIGRYDA